MEGDTLKTFDKRPGFNDCISSNLPPRAMRYSMENKNNLEKRGSIYVGLGTKRETTINVGTINGIEQDGVNETEVVTQKFEIPQTGIITPPTSRGTYVLVCKVDDNGSVEEMGWVDAASITTGSIVSGIKDVNVND